MPRYRGTRQALLGSRRLGPELLVNGDLESGATGWSVAGNDATHVATFSGGNLQYVVDTSTPALIVSQTAAPMVIGRRYQVIVICSAATGSVRVGNISADAVIVTAAGTYTATILAAATGFFITRVATPADVTINSVSLREVL